MLATVGPFGTAPMTAEHELTLQILSPMKELHDAVAEIRNKSRVIKTYRLKYLQTEAQKKATAILTRSPFADSPEQWLREDRYVDGVQIIKGTLKIRTDSSYEFTITPLMAEGRIKVIMSEVRHYDFLGF